MSSQKKTIVFFSKNKLSVSEVSLDKNPSVKTMAEFSWTDDNLVAISRTINKIVHGRVRLIIGEDSSYVFALPIPVHSGKEHLRQLIKEKAQLLIPDNLDETIWDFKEDDENGRPIVQIVSFTKEVIKALKLFIGSSSLIVEAVEPFSTALARLTIHEPELHYILSIGPPSLFVFCYKGTVFATYLIDDDKFSAAFSQLSLFVKNHFNLVIGKIIVSGNNSHSVSSILRSKGFTVVEKNLDAKIGIALKQDIKGEDANVLNFDFVTNVKKNDNLNKLLLGIVALLFFLISVFIFLIPQILKGR